MTTNFLDNLVILNHLVLLHKDSLADAHLVPPHDQAPGQLARSLTELLDDSQVCHQVQDGEQS